ncbi:MAG: tol-pal system protein YbgF, partial [Gammaproteobacteria bacterium]
MKLTTRYSVLGVILPAVLLLGGCVGGNVKPDDPVAIKLDQVEERVDHIDRVLKNQSLVDLSDRIDELQQEVRQLRGDLETLRHDVDGLKQRQRDLYLDVDHRLRALELNMGGSAGGSQSASGGPDTGGTSPAAVLPSGPDAGNTGGSASEQSGGASGGDSAVYQAAFELLKQGRYDQAKQAFGDFLKKFPASALDDNAQYWLGEANYVTRDFKQALAEFQKVISNYPKSSKAPDAWLKIGYCNYELSNWDSARKALD